MKAILKEDTIIQLTIDRGVEVGNIPTGVSLERLRWDGSKLIDLMKLRTIHVRQLAENAFELHAVPVAGSRPVAMSYKDRKRLRANEQGIIYIAPDEQLVEEKQTEQLKAAEVKLCHNLGGNPKAMKDMLAFIAALVVYASTGAPALKAFFDEITPHIKDAFPMDRYEEILRQAAKNLKTCLDDYHSECDEILK